MVDPKREGPPPMLGAIYHTRRPRATPGYVDRARSPRWVFIPEWI